MESVNDALNKWIEKWKQGLSWRERWDVNGWHKEDDLSVESNADYWDDEEDNHPPHSLRRSAKNRLIKEAVETGRVIDLDRIYKDGKIFGYEVECTKDEKGAITKLKATDSDHEYIVSFRFDWVGFNLLIQAFPADRSKNLPEVIRSCTSLDVLLALKYDLMEYAVRDTVNRIIAEFERRYNDYD